MRKYLKIFFFILITLCIGSNSSAQSLLFEIGASKHFVPEAKYYEQPNLSIQIRHRVLPKLEYSISYYNSVTYNPYPDHPIIPWNGDPKELISRQIYGLDFSFNFLLPMIDSTVDVGLTFGSTARLREEWSFILCQNTAGGWMECFGEIEKPIDIGLNIQAYFNYYILKKYGLSLSINERLYTAGPSTFSINLGAIYKLNY